jgi:uncharacterized membrane protein
MKKNVLHYLVAVVVFLVLDVAWVVLMNQYYIEQYGAAIRGDADGFVPIWWAAIIAYALIPLGVVLFSGYRTSTSRKKTVITGAVFGAIAYGIHDFTNLATVADWGMGMAFVSTLWGGVLCGAIAFVLYTIYSRK